ncbi:NAD-dependent epimerase/dehydratase family protein [bacterium]|nr:MAG: NAD-dependent epimerase/dehydratase family protein [bacterium]
MTVLVTGGAGFIGSHVCEALLAQNHKVICYDNFDEFYDPKIKELNISNCISSLNFKLIRNDILNFSDLCDVFRSDNIDLVIHLAARAGVRPSIQNPKLYQKVNIEGTMNVLEALRAFSVKKFILASSSSVYGNNLKTPYSETDNVDHVISPYAATKKACEVLAYAYHHLYQIDTFCLRFFTVYGPRQRPEMAIHYFTRSIDQNEKINLYGDGTSRRDYTYISDIVDGILKSMNHLNGYEILNLGEAQTISLADIVSIIEQELSKKAMINWLPMQPGDVEKTFADIAKAKEIIGYHPKTQIKTGIKTFIQWYRDNFQSNQAITV